MDVLPREPNVAVPRGATDCHMHIFGLQDRYPQSPTRTYTAPPASIARYRALAETLGLSRVVVVQPSAYGTDNSCTLDAVEALGGDARAVVGIDAATSEEALDHMAARGARGVRLNAASQGLDEIYKVSELVSAIAQRIARLGWHLQIFTDLAVISGLAPLLRTLSVPVVFDHMGLAKGELGLEQPGFDALRELLATGRCWVKLSGAYRVSSREPDFPDAAPIIRALVVANPDRVVWGTDWPHTASHRHVASNTAPLISYRSLDTAALLEQFAQYAGDTATLKKVLVDNPVALYGF
jgi:predicted TIM-barrel fold metal-dependent hydrolase